MELASVILDKQNIDKYIHDTIIYYNIYTLSNHIQKYTIKELKDIITPRVTKIDEFIRFQRGYDKYHTWKIIYSRLNIIDISIFRDKLIEEIYRIILDENKFDRYGNRYSPEEINEHRGRYVDDLPENNIEYIKYLCRLKTYLLENPIVVRKGRETSQICNNNLFFPKKEHVFYTNLLGNLLEPDVKRNMVVHTPYIRILEITDNFEKTKNIDLYTKNEQKFKDYQIKSNFKFANDKYFVTGYLENPNYSGKYTYGNYFEYLMTKYTDIINSCAGNHSCLRNIIQQSYLSNISEISSMELVFELLLSVYIKHIELYNNLVVDDYITTRWKNVLKEFLLNCHNSLFIEGGVIDYNVEFDKKKYEYKKNIGDILDFFQFGIRKFEREMMPNIDYYATIFFICKARIPILSATIIYTPKSTENIITMNKIIQEYIHLNYRRTKQYHNDILIILKRICILKINMGLDLLNIDGSELRNLLNDGKYDKIDITTLPIDNSEYIKKINTQIEIGKEVDDFLYIDAEQFIQTKNKQGFNAKIQPLVFGYDYNLDKYGFKLNNYKWKMCVGMFEGLTNHIHWTPELNNVVLLNFAKSTKLFSGIFLIEPNKLPKKYNEYTKYINHDPEVFIHTHSIEIKLSNDIKSGTTILNVFCDKSAKTEDRKLIILNSRGRTVLPPEILENYGISYRELYIMSQIYNCVFFRNKKFPYIFLVSPAEYAARIPVILKKLDLYDDFISKYEPVFLVKDVKNYNNLVIINKKFEVIGYPETLEDVYGGDIKIINSESRQRLPFHIIDPIMSGGQYFHNKQLYKNLKFNIT